MTRHLYIAHVTAGKVGKFWHLDDQTLSIGDVARDIRDGQIEPCGAILEIDPGSLAIRDVSKAVATAVAQWSDANERLLPTIADDWCRAHGAIEMWTEADQDETEARAELSRRHDPPPFIYETKGLRP